jgi:hypothetical protein
MSNSMKIKKKKPKKMDSEATKNPKQSKYGAKFMKGNQEKGTIASNFSGKSSKDFSRKKK